MWLKLKRIDILACAIGTIGGGALGVTLSSGNYLAWGLFGAVSGFVVGITTWRDPR